MSKLTPYIHRSIVVLHEDDAAETAAKAMDAHGIGCVVVADRHGHMTGILTDRDLACRVLARERDGSVPLSEIMTSAPTRVAEDATLDSVVQLMVAQGIRRVPVVQALSGGREKCVGLVSLDDLIAGRDIDDYHLMRIARAQTLRRARGARDLNQAREARPHLLAEAASASGLPPEVASKVLAILLFGLVRRLHHTAATRLILELPPEFQGPLLETPSGPDSSVTAGRLALRAETDAEIPRPAAIARLKDVARALLGWVGEEGFAHVLAQLPADLRELFVEPERAEQRRAS